MKIGSYQYVEKNGVWREEFVEDKANNPDGCCTFHYLLTAKRDRCDTYERHPKKGDILIGSCNGCRHFVI